MNPFAYERAVDAAGAVAAVTARPGAAFLGGGTNLVDHMKLGLASPDLLVDVTHLSFDRVEPLQGGGVRIGAGVRNSDLAADKLIRSRYPVLSQALLAGASGQLAIPQLIKLGIKPFIGGAAYKLEARFRYRITAAKLLMRYELVKPHLIIQDAVNDMVQIMKTETGAANVYEAAI